MYLKKPVKVEGRTALKGPQLHQICFFKQCDLLITTLYFTASMILYIYVGDH